MHKRIAGAALLASFGCATVGAGDALEGFTIPRPGATAARTVTVDDVAAVRSIDTICLSDNGQRYAILVRQADPANNRYRSAWFAGDTQGGPLVSLGGGGQVGPRVMFTGHTPGFIDASECRWSPDGQWIAYTARHDDEVQLWRSRADGKLQQQLTRNPADVRDFAWSEDGRSLYFSAGSTRAQLQARNQAREWQGLRYDEDLWSLNDLLAPQLIRPLETQLTTWVVVAENQQERRGGPTEQEALTRARSVLKPPIQLDKQISRCVAANKDRLICVRETVEKPAHLVSVDSKLKRQPQSIKILAEVNPEFTQLRLGKVERFEWDTPKFAWNEPGGALAGLYPKRTHGYILYPPDFDARKKYPVFVDPYVADGFHPLGAEHALHAYAAAGFVVIRMSFPMHPSGSGPKVGMKQMYSEELGFPHLTMLAESTLRGLDTVIQRGFVDERRVGIGGVSHGTFVPLYLMQKHDRIAAISISSPSWGGFQYYMSTRKAHEEMKAFRQSPDDEWVRSLEDDESRRFWKKLDIAENVETLEAPVLMQLAAQETYPMIRLIRNMTDAGKPYDAYVFQRESHLKWQPAHLLAITRRNLDWFRFWLQGVEDSAPEKAEQYVRWRQLKAGRSPAP